MIGPLPVRIAILICACFLVAVLCIYVSLPNPIPRQNASERPKEDPRLSAICTWTGEDALRRAEFCSSEHLSKMFRHVCICGNPAPITFNPVQPLKMNFIPNVPVLIIAANRPQYLFRTLTSVLNAIGVQKDNILVSIDGDYSDSAAVGHLFGVRTLKSTPSGTKSGRISQHYRRAIDNIMNNEFKDAQFLIIIEDDLTISPDFFLYFDWSLELFELDNSLYCISAWNDHGMNHAVGNETMFSRVEGMPGLGWAISRPIIDEILPKWLPKERMTDWDVWMRKPSIRKARDCLIPDISRSYHFGENGMNVNEAIQQAYFRHHAVNKKSELTHFPPIQNYQKLQYDQELLMIIKEAEILKSNPCDESRKKPASNFGPPPNSNQTFVLYYQQSDIDDLTNWYRVAWCLGIWDRDIRAQYHGVTRIHINKTSVLLIAHPWSTFSLKPDDIKPIIVSESIPSSGKIRK